MSQGEGARAATARAPLRVLGWPAFANRAEQPYNALLYSHLQDLGVEVAEASAARVLGGRYHVLHLHWPDRRIRSQREFTAWLRGTALIVLLDAARRRRMRIVWTVHNLAAHEGTHHPRLESRYFDALTRRLDGIIALSEYGVRAARERYPRLRERPAFVVPHGHLRGVYADVITREQARAQLGLAGATRVIAFIGQVREYKNVPQLIEQFRALDGDLLLLIAGKAKPAPLGARIAQLAADDPRVRFIPSFVPDDELQIYLRAADLVVLPYRDILNSGSALLALSFDRPVLVPRRGAMDDLAAAVGDAWVRTYDGELTTNELRDALWWATRRRPWRAPLDDLGWDRIAQQTHYVYRALMSTLRR
jgi:glycosyltransferase involved in cell wall biosynthesis